MDITVKVNTEQSLGLNRFHFSGYYEGFRMTCGICGHPEFLSDLTGLGEILELAVTHMQEFHPEELQ